MAALSTNLSIHYCTINSTAADWRWDSRRNAWDGWLLWYVAGGDGEISYPGSGGASYPITPGSCFVFDMREHHRGRAAAPIEVHAIGFTSTGDGRLWPGQRRHRRLRQRRMVQDLIDRCVAANHQRDSTAAVHWLRSALMIVAEEDARPRLAGKALQQEQAITALIERMQADLARSWSVADVIQALGVGREQAIHIFKEHRGLPPGRWLISARIDRARHLLRFSSESVKAIAALVGYADPFYFSRLFKREVGCSPRAFRQQSWEEDSGNV